MERPRAGNHAWARGGDCTGHTAEAHLGLGALWCLYVGYLHGSGGCARLGLIGHDAGGKSDGLSCPSTARAMTPALMTAALMTRSTTRHMPSAFGLTLLAQWSVLL
eukprot:COSAG02_NODE_3240_length_7111_cov_9.714632_4_plen_106_part_00